MKSLNTIPKDELKCPLNYSELHSLDFLNTIRFSNNSDQENKIVSLTCIELTLFVLTNTISKLILLFELGDTKKLVTCLQWVYSLLKFITNMSRIVENCRIMKNDSCIVTIESSLAYQEFVSKLKQLDACFINSEQFNLTQKKIQIAGLNPTENEYFVHYLKLSMAEIDVALIRLRKIPTSAKNYHDLFDSNSIKEMIHAYKGFGEQDFLVEFRAMHQVQEILFESFNNSLNQANITLKNQLLHETCCNLKNANILGRGIIEAQRILSDTLKASDYYEFRSFLGASSGIQSLNIKRNCFSVSFPQFCDSLKEYFDTNMDLKEGFEILKNIEINRDVSIDGFFSSLIIEETQEISDFLSLWREIHLHFPRNLLGGNHNGYGTSSMIGVKDGLATVKKMKYKSEQNDYIRQMRTDLVNKQGSLIEENDCSRINLQIMNLLVEFTGAQTQLTFPEVQASAFHL